MPFASTPLEIVGELDQWSPTVRVEFRINARAHALLCHVDTGSLDSIVFTDYDEATRLGLRFNLSYYGSRIERYLANGSPAYFVAARTTLIWFSSETVTVLAPDPRSPLPPSPVAQTSDDTPPPRILVGIPLLLGTTMSLDFLANPGSVRITAPPAGYVRPLPL